MYQAPATEGWLNVSDAAVLVQGMLPNTCRVVVEEVKLLPRRVRGLLPPSARQNVVPEVAAPKAEKGGSPCAKLSNVGLERKVSMSKRTRPIVKAREARKRRQVKELLPSDPPATFGADNPSGQPQAANDTTPIVKAREAGKRRQGKELLPSDLPATFGGDNPPGPPQAANDTTPNQSNLNVGVSAYTSPGLGTN